MSGSVWRVPNCNGYIASIARHRLSPGSDQGLFEVAVIDPEGDTADTEAVRISVGELNEEDVRGCHGEDRHAPPVGGACA